MKQHLSTVLRLLIFCVLQCLLSVFVGEIKADNAEAMLLILGAGILLLCISVFFFTVTCVINTLLPQLVRVLCPLGMVILSFAGFPLAFVRYFVDAQITAALISAGIWGIATILTLVRRT